MEVAHTPVATAGGAQNAAEPQVIPARMLNEFVSCPRLFYCEFVEGVFVESADTLRGEAIHQRVDTGDGGFGRPALALDLMEEFRPLIAESTVLSCLNNRVFLQISA